MSFPLNGVWRWTSQVQWWFHGHRELGSLCLCFSLSDMPDPRRLLELQCMTSELEARGRDNGRSKWVHSLPCIESSWKFAQDFWLSDYDRDAICSITLTPEEQNIPLSAGSSLCRIKTGSYSSDSWSKEGREDAMFNLSARMPFLLSLPPALWKVEVIARAQKTFRTMGWKPCTEEVKPQDGRSQGPWLSWDDYARPGLHSYGLYYYRHKCLSWLLFWTLL